MTLLFGLFTGKRMRMVQRVRVDGGTGKEVIIKFKEEVPSDWASSEEDEEEENKS